MALYYFSNDTFRNRTNLTKAIIPVRTFIFLAKLLFLMFRPFY